MSATIDLPAAQAFVCDQQATPAWILGGRLPVDGKVLEQLRLWLQTGSAGLLALTLLAPLSEPLEKVLQLLAVAAMLVFLLTDSISRREFVRFLIPLVTLVVLALLVSIDPKW